VARSPVFVHLRSRSPYSLLEGALKIEETAQLSRRMGMPALALTDTNNMCGALEFSEVMSNEGIQPIIGLTLNIDTVKETNIGHSNKVVDGTLVLLAKNEIGYGNLMKMSSSAFLDVEAYDLPHFKSPQLSSFSDGLIALTGGPEGVLNKLIIQGQLDQAEEWLDSLLAIYSNNLYIELQRHGLKEELIAEKHLINWAYSKGIRLVATNEPYFINPDIFEPHDALLAMQEGSYILEKDRRRLTRQHYFKSSEEMVELFKDIPEAIENTINISKMCLVKSVKRDPILPSFSDGSLSEGDILDHQAREGLRSRLSKIKLSAPESDYVKRLEFEIKIIRQMGFPGYFLIVSDFIKWAKSQGIPVGPGRGSGAGSVVAWALDITDLDPLKYGLLFERFLNPERVSMPDFDIDFCQERRGEVIKYVQEKYGEDQVAHIITFGTLQARAVVRDVGRVMQMPLPQVDRLAKLVPSNPANPVSLSEAVQMEKGLRDARTEDPAVRKLLDTALKLEGLYRNASTHAAGVVIGDRPLTELIPLYRDPRSDVPATQFTMKWAEKAGLVKFDFLGLKTLTVIDRCVKYLSKQGIKVDLENLDTSSPAAYTPLSEGLSAGIFQLESSGMRDVLRKMAPDSIEELTALISLYRPGPMKNIPMYIDRKYGRSKIEYPHESLKGILKETYGVIIYQEQVMQIAQVLSGYSLGEADLLRRAMGKKDQDEMNRQRSRFVDGAAINGIDEQLSNSIFDLVNEFAGYGFNKSHAAAYAMISFQTAYLKAFYPTEFIASIMSMDITNLDKLAQFFQEAKRMGIEVQLPCVNRSKADFDVSNGKVLYALGALKNVGVEAMRHVVEVRSDGGDFIDLFDFARRVDTRIVNKRAFENLARGGAFDCLEPNRAKAFSSSLILQQIGSRSAQEKASEQANLFSGEVDFMVEPDLPNVTAWTGLEQLDNELSAIGFYLGGHPLDAFLPALERKKAIMAIDLENFCNSGGRAVRLAGVVRKRQERVSKRGKRFAFMSISDPTGDFEVLVGEDLLVSNRTIMDPGTLLELTAKAEVRDGEVRLFANTINLLELKEEKNTAKGLEIRLRSAELCVLDEFEKVLLSLKDVPSKAKGFIDILIPISSSREGHWRLSGSFGIDIAFQKAIKANSFVELVTEVD